MNERFEEIRAKYNEQLSDLICSKVNHNDCCKDILQEVYIKIIQNLDKIDLVENQAPYLTRIAMNTVADHFRSGNQKKLEIFDTEMPSDMENPEAEKTYKLATGFMLEMIDALPPIYKQALVAAELKSVSQKQLAMDLGVSYSGLKSRVQRAREMLRQSIMDCCNYTFDPYGNVLTCCGQDCC